jgi:hypothetical protein
VENVLTSCDDQKSPGLSELLENYSEKPIRGIDISKYAPPKVEEGATLEELKEAEKRGRIGEGHMALRYVKLDRMWKTADRALNAPSSLPCIFDSLRLNTVVSQLVTG